MRVASAGPHPSAHSSSGCLAPPASSDVGLTPATGHASASMQPLCCSWRWPRTSWPPGARADPRGFALLPHAVIREYPRSGEGCSRERTYTTAPPRRGNEPGTLSARRGAPGRRGGGAMKLLHKSLTPGGGPAAFKVIPEEARFGGTSLPYYRGNEPAPSPAALHQLRSNRAVRSNRSVRSNRNVRSNRTTRTN